MVVGIIVAARSFHNDSLIIRRFWQSVKKVTAGIILLVLKRICVCFESFFLLLD